jgi:glutaredoxin
MTSSVLPLVELFGKPDCHLCEDAKHLLQTLQVTYNFTLHEINIAEYASLQTQYGEETPVVFINGRKAFKYRIDATQFGRRLQRAQRHASSSWRTWLWRENN